MENQAILSNLVVACLIGGLAMTIGRHGRRASLAHVLWIAFFIKLITPPIWQFGIAIPHLPIWELSWLSIIGNWLLLVWFGGFLFLTIRGIVVFLRFASLLKREGRQDREATEYVASLLEGRKHAPLVVRLPLRLSPMLFGSLLNPKIVCPDELWEVLTDNQRRAFLAHETGHFYRRDHWVRWLEWTVTAIYWWFPGVYFGRGQLQRHEETCCDAWAVRRLQTTPRAYAETLLSVVDFVSERDARLPRLANGMQPTYTLEERLRLLMRPQKNAEPSSALATSVLSICAGLLFLHPTLVPSPILEVASAHTPKRVDAIEDEKVLPESEEKGHAVVWPDDHILPKVPSGFWNAAVEPKWADFTLQLGNARITGEAGKGISITSASGKSLKFAVNELVAMAEIPSTGRLVIGDVQGRLRLWDLQAGTAVSLIGMHNASITSVAYHPKMGLFSADVSGQVIRWDLESGLVLARRNINVPIQVIRTSEDGEQLAVLTGNWQLSAPSCTFQFLDCKTLDNRVTMVQPHSVATLVELPILAAQFLPYQFASRWFTVDWQGQLRSIGSADVVIGQFEKNFVSSLVVAQQKVTAAQIAAPPRTAPKPSEPKEFIYVEQ